MVRSIAIAAGGTGGHVIPAQALAGYLEAKKSYKPMLVVDSRGAVFVSTSGVALKDIVIIPTVRFDKLMKIVPAFVQLASSVVKLLRCFLKAKPAAVIGFGGYASFPALLAGIFLRIPIVLHESNAVMGRTNGWFLPFASAVMVSFPDTKGIKGRYMNKVVVTGTPVRSSIVEASQKERKSSDKSEFVILIIGGSQGAKVVSEAVPKAISLLPENIRRRLVIWHQAREEQVQEVIDEYSAAEVSQAVVASFFPDDNTNNSIANLMHQADLVIARAGASTISELNVMGKATILIPFAGAKDNHQYYNSLTMVTSGAALMIEEGQDIVKELNEAILSLLTASEKIEIMATKAVNTIHINSPALMMDVINNIAA